MSSLPLLPDCTVEVVAEKALDAASCRIISFGKYKEICDPQGSFCDNSVTTNKYSLIPINLNFFLWKNLFEQFHRAANVYFLLVAVLQMIPGISPTGRYTTITPLIIVLFISMVKDVYEDYRRHVADKEANHRETRVYREGHWQTILWKEVQVGDFVHVMKNDSIPADLLVLTTSEQEGICYIETSSLDGENNLKIRYSVPQIQQIFDAHECYKFTGQVVCELPNDCLYMFDGYFQTEAIDGRKIRVPLNPESILLRGATLRNTKEVYAAVIFTGKDTKLMMNMTARHHKVSSIDGITNKQIMFIFCILLTLCVICAIGLSISMRKLKTHWYLRQDTRNPGRDAVVGFFTFIILFNNLIPISLYVSMEVVKVIQGGFISGDVELHYEKTNTSANARTSALNEELGQVGYILSDKTGTLTCNVMEFRRFSCNSLTTIRQGIPIEEVMSYGCEMNVPDSAATALLASPTGKYQRETSEHDLLRVIDDAAELQAHRRENFNFYDPRISDGHWVKQPNAEQLGFFLRFMAICHTVVAEHIEGETSPRYAAASPDEACLVKAASELGVTFLSRSDKVITINVCGEVETWELLNIIEFDCVRKRMSFICRDPTRRIVLLTKGADTVIFERLKPDMSKKRYHEDTVTILNKFATEGLRTLVFAAAFLEEKLYAAWSQKFESACLALHERSEQMSRVANEIEVNLQLIGTTAIEDRLQDEVPSTIELLTHAGIKIWVLTGDKQETAVSTGYACSLLRNDQGFFMFNECNEENILSALEKYVHDAEQACIQEGQDLSLVIDGVRLLWILPTADKPRKESADLFMRLAALCKTVVCCRVSPAQKAQVVQLLRSHTDAITLAVGDGGNDVEMIQEAHVGVGIAGLEGLQAARSSDYSIAQFRYLQRLLLVHGRWNYRRVSKLIVYSFYKNQAMYLTQFWFCFFNAFTGQSLYDPWSLAAYNIAFSAFPVMALAILDRDVEPKRTLSITQFPELYQKGIRSYYFNRNILWQSTVNAIFHSAISFFIPFICYHAVVNPRTGHTFSSPGLGVLCYSSVIFIVNLKVSLQVYSWTFLNAIATLGSLLLWYVFVIAYGSLNTFIPGYKGSSRWYKIGENMFPLAQYWLIVIVTVVLACMRDFFMIVWQRNCEPDLIHKVRQWELLWPEKKKLYTAKGVMRGDKQDFDRDDIKYEVPRLFPKQEVKPFLPDLTKGVGHHRFAREQGTVTPSQRGSLLPPGRKVSALLLHTGFNFQGVEDILDVDTEEPTFGNSASRPRTTSNSSSLSNATSHQATLLRDGSRLYTHRRRRKISDIVEDESFSLDSRTSSISQVHAEAMFSPAARNDSVFGDVDSSVRSKFHLTRK